jgi:hypothetical protein
MVKLKTIRLDPQGIKGVMDIGGPSALNTSLDKPRKVYENKSDKKTNRKSAILTKEPRHALRSPVSVKSDIPSSEYSDSEMASIWASQSRLWQSQRCSGCRCSLLPRWY